MHDSHHACVAVEHALPSCLCDEVLSMRLALPHR